MVVLSGSPSWRRGRCFLAILAVLLVVGVVSPVGTTIVGGADAATTASVSPAVGLVDGQSVTVTGSSDADWVLAAVCPAALVDDALFGCLFSDRSVGVEPGAAADFSVELRVSVLTGSGATDVDCRTSSCELVVMGWESDLAAAEVIRLAIAFDPAGPLVPGPVLTIDPAKQWEFEDYDTGETWTVSGKEIREKGFEVVIPNRRDSRLIFYRAER